MFIAYSQPSLYHSSVGATGSMNKGKERFFAIFSATYLFVQINVRLNSFSRPYKFYDEIAK